jgi:hypothetical protein
VVLVPDYVRGILCVDGLILSPRILTVITAARGRRGALAIKDSAVTVRYCGRSPEEIAQTIPCDKSYLHCQDL